jgi:hypothetical protein
MKFFQTILAVFFALLTLCILLMFGTVFIAWLSGGGNVFLPGLGLVITAPLVLATLLILAIITFAVTLLIFKKMRKNLS